MRRLWVAVFWLSLLVVGGCGGGADGFSQLQPPSARLKGVASGQSGFTVNLRTGWNALGFQQLRLSAVNAPAAVLGMSFYSGNEYTTKPLSVAEVNAAGTSKGFWVFATAPTSFTYSGTDGSPDCPLVAGWNLVSFPSLTDVQASTLVARRAGLVVPLNSVVLPQFFEIGADSAYTAVDVSSSGALLRAGRAYWAFASEAVTLSYTGTTPAPSPSPASAVLGLTVTPNPARVGLFGTVQFTATARFADGTTRDVTAESGWASADPFTAALLGPGLFKGLNPFSTQISATFGGVTAGAGLTVSGGGGGGPGPTPTPGLGSEWRELQSSAILTGVTFGNNLFVAVGPLGIVRTSPDGVTWTGRTTGTGVNLSGATFGNNLFVVVGNTGTIATSPDGVAWTTRTSGTGELLVGATFANNLFVVVGNAGTILTSPDGVTWTPRTSGTAQALSSVTFGNNRFAAWALGAPS